MSKVQGVDAILSDPLKLNKFLWPHEDLYREQRMITRSVWENDETAVPACHMSGKDFVTARIVLDFFLTRHPCRILTTSVDGKQLEAVLWGEIRNAIQTSRYPLEHHRGGPLMVNHLHLRKVRDGKVCGLSYIMGRTAEKGEGLSGHHIANRGDGIPRTLAVFDEASGIDKESFEKVTEWADRILMIGNPYDCDNRFYHAVEGGDVRRSDGRFSTKVIEIPAEITPNVRLALLQRSQGIEPTGEMLVPGILPYDKYLDRLRKWDQYKVTVGIKAKFYKGKEVKLWPPDVLSACVDRARSIRGRRVAKSLGIDSAEGGDNTSFTAGDELGIMEQQSLKTVDTNVIVGRTKELGRRLNIPPENWVFDRGGGGKQHADRLRAQGFPCRTVAFGGAVAIELHTGITLLVDRIQHVEAKDAFFNRRAQMFGEFAELCAQGYGIPPECEELLRQLSKIPKRYDAEGRLKLPPKNKVPGSNVQTLVDLIGHSPDEADSAVLMAHGLLHQEEPMMAGAIG